MKRKTILKVSAALKACGARKFPLDIAVVMARNRIELDRVAEKFDWDYLDANDLDAEEFVQVYKFPIPENITPNEIAALWELLDLEK